MLPYVSDFLFDEMANATNACFTSTIIDQFMSASDFADEQDGNCESSVGAATLVYFGDDATEMRVALTILSAYADGSEHYAERVGWREAGNGMDTAECMPSAWETTSACIVFHDDQKWWGDASFFDTTEDAKKAFTIFQQDYADAILLGYLDGLGLVGKAAWSMSHAEALHQIREANAFSDEEWEALTDTAWDAS